MAWFQSSMSSLTMMAIWHQWMMVVTSVCYKTLFGHSCGTLRHFLLCGGCKMALHHIAEMQFSHLSTKSFEAESFAEGQRTRGQRTVRTSSPPTFIFGRQRKIRFLRKKLTGSTLWCNVWKVSPKNKSMRIRRSSKNVLKRAKLCLKSQSSGKQSGTNTDNFYWFIYK